MTLHSVTGPYLVPGDLHSSFRITTDDKIVASVYAADGDEEKAQATAISVALALSQDAETIAKAAQFFGLIEGAKAAGKSWWADAQLRQIEEGIEQDRRIEVLEEFYSEVWGWLLKRGLVDNDGDEWDGFVAVIEEHEAEIEASALRTVNAMQSSQIKHMVDRFLAWKLPENFNPDAGISFKAAFNENTAHPMRHEPSGTNLFDASQAEAMVRHMLEGMPEGAGVQVKALVESNMIRWAHDTLYEINPSNYDHAEVCKLNDASVKVILGLAQYLGEKHGKTAEWWSEYSANHPLPALAPPSLPVGDDLDGLVERLNKAAGPVRLNNGCFADLAFEAANSIAALRADRDEAMEELGRVIMACPQGMRTSPASDGVKLLRAENERLTRERDEARAERDYFSTGEWAGVEKATEQLEQFKRFRAENERLTADLAATEEDRDRTRRERGIYCSALQEARKALKPFATFADHKTSYVELPVQWCIDAARSLSEESSNG
ncbi:hypothetical protein [Mesorhizobium sp. Cs1299R1N3]|uniref:hypothetical protein n=1 Tax=Mesorhizobium sp. Cs1299R1N3 TaxID=3015173 RepID=UPI00301E60D8